jgi:hypothetical protein
MRAHRRLAVVASLLGALLTGCSAAASPSLPGSTGAPATTSATPSAAPAITATPRPAPTVPLGPPVSLTLDAAGPMVASDAGPAGRHWVLPAAAARDSDGGFVMFIVWFGDDAGDQIVTVARSDDGRAWQVGKDPIFTDLGMDLDNPGPIPAAVLELEDGSWLLYGWGIHRSNLNRLTSWRASAPTPEGPWMLDEAVVLDVGPAGSWDSQMAVVGSVQPTAEGFGMWYEGQGIGSTVRGDIGFATSPDGLTWQKADLPAIPRNHCDSAGQAAQQPQVERWSGGFVAAIGTVGAGEEDLSVSGLTSTDGFLWACASDAPMLRAADIPGSQGIHTIASVPLDGDRFELIIESLRDGRSELWSAIVEVGAAP